MTAGTTSKKQWFVGITSFKDAKKRVYEGDMHENKLVATYETEEAAAHAVAEHNAEMGTPAAIVLPAFLADPIQPAIDAGYKTSIGVSIGALCLSLIHDRLPHIVIWGSNEVEVMLGSRVAKFEGDSAIQQAVAAALAD